MSGKKGRPRHPLRDSCLFRVSSRARLARYLRVSVSFLEAQTKFKSPYNEFELDGRWIEEPKPGLKKVQARFAFLLSQIQTPLYLHSAVKGRSYITNACDHLAAYPSIKADVKKFFPSARSAQVFHFFRDVLEWPSDVAGLGTALFTWRGHLPTGGNASPILSFWAYKPLFDDIACLAEENGCLFSLYVDDMTLTGEFASRSLLFKARSLVGQHGLRAHKLHHFGAEQDRVVTGVANTNAGTRLPVRRQRLIMQAQDRLRAANSDAERREAFKPLIGRICEAVEVDPFTWKPRAERLLQEFRAFNRKDLLTPASTPPTASVARAIAAGAGAGLPW